MIGEALRDVGILAAVFIPLDHLFSDGKEDLPTWIVVIATVTYGGVIWFLGVLIEEHRE